MENLEQRLAGINTPQAKDALIQNLAVREYSMAADRNNPYLKYDLIAAIIGRIDRYAQTSPKFDSNLNSTINKDEAKRIYYGLKCMGQPAPVMKSICECLSDWEKVLFFAGIWKNRTMKDIRSKTLPDIVFENIKAGYDAIHKRHMIKFAEGEYQRTLKIPESQNYHKDKAPENLMPVAVEFKKLLDAEAGGNEDMIERTAIYLDSCSEEDRKYLTETFGAEKLGGYAVE